MKRIVLDCKGRMANQILCWANAVYVLGKLGLTDRTIVVNYPAFTGALNLRGAVAESIQNPMALPPVTRNDLAKREDDVLWIWSDVYSNFPPFPELEKIIATIELTPSMAGLIAETIGAAKCIGIHARFGDYVRIDPDHPPLVRPPFVRGSEQYFLRAIALCKERFPGHSIFLSSDGNASELEFITRQYPVIAGKHSNPIHDLFCLTRCQVIIGSNSTFTAIAGCYRNVPVMLPGMSDIEIKGVIEKAAR